MLRALPLLALVLAACWRSHVPAVVELTHDQPPPAPPPAPAPLAEQPLFEIWHYEGRCPVGMNLVEGGRFTPQQVARLNALLDDWTTYDFAAPIEDFCLAVEETSYLEYWNCVQSGHCREAQDLLKSSGRRCVAADAECPEDMHALALGTLLTSEMAEEYCLVREARLPSLVEWYWAALGGTEDRHYPWGNALPSEELLNVTDLSYVTRICGKNAQCMAEVPRVLQGDDGYALFAPTDGYPAGAARWGQLNMLGNASEFATFHPHAGGELATCGRTAATETLEALDLHGDVCRVFEQTVGVRCAAPARAW